MRIQVHILIPVLLTLALGAFLVVPAAAQEYPRYRAVGSSFVPLDSWVYPALERLAVSGYVKTAIVGIKPWTRIECARLTEEAGESIQEAILEDRVPGEQVAETYSALEREFDFELNSLAGGSTRSLRLESVYARTTSISGPALTDGFHFGQTVSYDFGRPFGRGTNALAGAAGSGTLGPLAFYVRGEYQHAPAAPPLPQAALDTIAARDKIPTPEQQSSSEVNRGALLDAYVAFNVRNWQISVGKHSFAWGPGPDGALLLSQNAEPMYMLHLGRSVPFLLPGPLYWMGPIRTETFLARPEGHRVVLRPLMFGQKISAKPKPWIEIGLGRTITLGGGAGGDAFTFGNFFKAYFAQDRSLSSTDTTNPGDERNELDWTIYLPGDVVLYTEAFIDDTFAYLHPTWAVWRPGVYVARLPGLPQMDLRIEAANSEALGDIYRDESPGRNYWNFQYRDGHTNKGVLMGNTVGRMGRTFQVRSNYWFSPRHRIEVAFKNSTIHHEFIPGGARWQDYSARHEIALRSGMYVASRFQFERIARHPVLFDGRRQNTVASVEIGFTPEQPIL